MGRRLRTFIALELDKSVHANVVTLQTTLARRLPQVHWVEPSNLHLTLLFLGEVDERAVLDVCRVTAEAVRPQPAFAMTLAGLGGFPNLRRPRTLWVGVAEGVQPLTELHQRIEAALLAHGSYRREDRDFTPHVTLGRLKSAPWDAQAEPLVRSYQTWEGGTMQVREVLVMASELRREGPIYTVLSRARLAGKNLSSDRDTTDED